MLNNIYQHKQLQERQSASQALTSSSPAKRVVSSQEETKLSVACRSENTGCRQPGRMSSHSVYNFNHDGSSS